MFGVIGKKMFWGGGGWRAMDGDDDDDGVHRLKLARRELARRELARARASDRLSRSRYKYYVM